jgi:hypothetical protein
MAGRSEANAQAAISKIKTLRSDAGVVRSMRSIPPSGALRSVTMDEVQTTRTAPGVVVLAVRVSMGASSCVKRYGLM